MCTVKYFYANLSEFSRLLRGKKCDVVGLLMIYLQIYLAIVPTVTLPCLSLTETDPLFALVYRIIPDDNTNSLQSLCIRITTFLLSYIIFSALCQTVRKGLVNCSACVKATLEILRDINRRSLPASSTRFSKNENYSSEPFNKFLKSYQTLYLVHCLHIQSSTMIAVLMGVGYVTIIVCGSVTLIGWAHLPPLAYWIFPMTALVTHILLLTSLPYAASSHILSSAMIHRWRREQSMKFETTKMRGLRPIGFQCGNIGVIGKECSTIYLSQLVEKTASVLLVIRTR